jgi:glutamyl-tRNA synthetase
MTLELRIEAHALANALKFGKANAANVLPKVIVEFPEVKKDIPALKQKIEGIVACINEMAAEKIRPRLEEIAPELLEKKQVKEKTLPPLPNAVNGAVVTRIPPEPSKYNHLGHALTFILNKVYADQYHGKVILRFEDANPEKVNQEFVDNMIDDITNYLGIHPASIRFVSDDMPVLLKYATQLIEVGGAFMCFCDREKMSRLRQEGVDCECRDKELAFHLHEWKHFLEGRYEKGEAVLRFKGNMQSQNTVMRDPVLWRTVMTPHFRVGSAYRVWPTYDFYSPIEEHLCGVTHVLRSNEFDLRVEVQDAIKRLLGLPSQEVLQYGRFNMTGAITQGREIREGIEKGEFLGWDDPRLVTLKALKRRGIKREAYYDLVNQLGLSPHPINLDFTMLAAANRKFIENVDRYSFIPDPVEVTVEGAEERELELDLHPDREGGRKHKVGHRYLVSHEDFEKFGVQRVRLMGNLTFQHGKLLQYKQEKGGHDLIINWLPAEGNIPIEVMMPDATMKQGMAEHNIQRLKVDDIIQFERFGFVRLDAIEQGIYKFWYAHK